MRSRAVLHLLVLSVLGCNRAVPVGPVPEPDNPVAAAASEYPTKAEVMDYLDGKTMPSKVPTNPNDKGIVLKREQIEALEVTQSATQFNDNPWTTDVTFLVRTPDGRYGARATVSHRKVEGKRAFFGVEFREVAKQ